MGRHTDPSDRTNPANTENYRPRHAEQETTPMDLPPRTGAVLAPGTVGRAAPGANSDASAVHALIARARGEQ